MAYRNWLTTGALCVAIVFAAYFSGLRPSAADAMLLPVDPARLVVATGSGERSFSIEIADTSAEREAGLMFRQSMADDHGMLFVFDKADQVAFWMKNTPMPLDIVFIGADGRINAIRRGEPESEAIIAPGTIVKYVLELKAGIAAKDGIEEGDQLRHPAIVAASGSN
ncbi:DUF192 domain-containing protein [Mesorhizobium sp. CU2]|uniref:DUF192 domain-containing protein n=1 Tax=unclassified Mesorhizobium TaxID=325217 RepID=UPI00112BE580|nr:MULTISPECIES: DUF192 domain-containing protein [unclassified Mesorhizobium]TPN88364.1 DUF192 domain-containing protein [Mesorhizobium sp. CU3]TPO10890.1 DUF192 domain-containing protein [Mesorhizobium sp. CU2]